MSNTKKHKVRRCGSCALLGGVKTGCPSPSALASYAACTTHFEANDTCRIADALEKLTAIEELFCDPAPDLSRLEQELRGLVTSAGVQRTEGREDEADRYERKAEVVRRCIAVMRGEVEPLELEL